MDAHLVLSVESAKAQHCCFYCIFFRSPESAKSPERCGAQVLKEIVEDFIYRVEKLEADFFMYESGFSIHDFRLVSILATISNLPTLTYSSVSLVDQ